LGQAKDLPSEPSGALAREEQRGQVTIRVTRKLLWGGGGGKISLPQEKSNHKVSTGSGVITWGPASRTVITATLSNDLAM
jgi:hypothetical protein